MIPSNQDILRYLLAIIIFITFVATIIFFISGLKNKDYKKAKIFGISYLWLNGLRLLLEYFNLY